MNLSGLQIFLMIIGPVVLRPIIFENNRYLLACVFYGFMLGLGKMFIDDFYGGDE